MPFEWRKLHNELDQKLEELEKELKNLPIQNSLF
jgi:ribosomal protein L29